MISLKKWLRSITGTGDQTIEVMCEEVKKCYIEYSIRTIAFWSIVNRIANALCKCEFRTYTEKKETFADEYYLWNYSPNPNESADAFRKKLVSILFMKNEALVIEKDRSLYIADSFTKLEEGTDERRFENVTVNGQTQKKFYREQEVLYFRLNHENMKPVIDSIYENYKNLIDFSIKAYRRSKGSRGILNIDAIASEDENFKKNIEKLLNEDFKKFFEADNAVLPLFNGYEYKPNDGKTYSSDSTRDIKSQIDDIFDFTARAFSFPPSLAKGDVQDTGKAVEEMLTFCLDPTVHIIETEINRKRNGKKAIKGTYTKISTTSVKHIDLLDVGASVDKLIGSGITCVNDILRLVKMPEIDEEWASQHFLTKNYGTFEELMKLMKGGEAG